MISLRQHTGESGCLGTSWLQANRPLMEGRGVTAPDAVGSVDEPHGLGQAETRCGGSGGGSVHSGSDFLSGSHRGVEPGTRR